MSAVATHKGGPFYEWYVSVYGYAPPATVDSNASRYLAWQQGMPRYLAAGIPYGAFGDPGIYTAGQGIISPVLVTTPTSPTPVVAPIATIIEPGVTVIAPFAPPGPSGPAAGGPTGPTVPQPKDLGQFEATAYGPPWIGQQGTGVTATGVDLRDSPHRYIVAVDPSVIPLHSKLKISPNPFGDVGIVFAAEDTGGVIVGHKIDFYDWRGRASQDNWGRKNVDVVEVSASESTAPATSSTTLFNPLAHAHVTPERIDQGVDYAGTGYLAAIADGVIVSSVANGSGWEGEGWIMYRVTQDGFLKGAYIYYAEGVNPVVHDGELIRGGSRLCDLRQPMPHGIEIGFAAGNGEQSYYAYHDGAYREGTVTRPGLAMSNLIQALGGPPGRQEGSIVGAWPSYMPTGQPPADLTKGTTSAGVLSTQTELIPAGTVAGGFSFPDDYLLAWQRLKGGVFNGSHHSHAAQQYANGVTYLTKAA